MRLGLWGEDIISGLDWKSPNETWASSKYGTNLDLCVDNISTWQEENNLNYLQRGGWLRHWIAAKDTKIKNIDIKLATADPFSPVQERSSVRIQGLCCNSNDTIEELIAKVAARDRTIPRVTNCS